MFCVSVHHAHAYRGHKEDIKSCDAGMIDGVLGTKPGVLGKSNKCS